MIDINSYLELNRAKHANMSTLDKQQLAKTLNTPSKIGKFDVREFTAGMKAANKANIHKLVDGMSNAMPVSVENIKTIMRCLSKFNPKFYEKIEWAILDRFEETQDRLVDPDGNIVHEGSIMETAEDNVFIKGEQIVFVNLNDNLQMMIIHAIQDFGEEKADFELLWDIMEWYNIEREKLKKFGQHIPQDTRPGLYDGEVYDGTTYKDFLDYRDPASDWSAHEMVMDYLKEAA